ncbi:MAG TPA: PQQ-binding-like beta-propeller repeat protein [Acidobacteriota bacterium]|nr:PQQ-binding-like beta-propeller repeat protein [Acidobacteriota bacterium]
MLVRTFFLALAWLSLGTVAVAGNWPHWRGPDGSGVSQETGLPTSWSAEENIAWKAPLKGRGVSSPVVWEDTVFVTSQSGRGAVRSGNHPTLSRGSEEMERELSSGQMEAQGVVFLVQAFDTSDGSLRWEYSLDAATPLPEVHNKNNLATPSPVTDGSMVYAWFGTGQIVALDMQGREQWKRNLAQDYAPFQVSWGHASSPTLYKDTLFLLCDHSSESYLLALDKRDGSQKWKVGRESERGYSTPMVVYREQGDELIVNGNQGLKAYDPSSGELLWHLQGENRFPVPSPSQGDGMIFTSRGYRSGPYMAIEPGGRGNIADSHLKWRKPTGAPYVSSVVYYQGMMFFVNDSGVASAIDGDTGETLWRSRLGGVFSASPVAGDGKVYLTNEGGETTVLRSSNPPEVLSRNELGERCLASPAIAGGRLYLRTDQHLVAIGSPQPQSP